MSNKRKKKSKNSDYKYLQRKEDEWREEQIKAERKAEKNKFRILNILSVILVLGSMAAGLYAYTNKLNEWAPFYTFTSGIAVMLMAYTSKDRKPTFYKVGIGMGAVLIIAAYLIGRSQGLFGFGNR